MLIWAEARCLIWAEARCGHRLRRQQAAWRQQPEGSQRWHRMESR